MKFSIITVCLNAGNDLSETVASVLSQTETDYELLIKDGGSTDGSLEKLPSDSHIRLVSLFKLRGFTGGQSGVGKGSGLYRQRKGRYCIW